MPPLVDGPGSPGTISVASDISYARANMRVRTPRTPGARTRVAEPTPHSPISGEWEPLCMTADDYADWRVFNGRTASQRVPLPCSDCPASYAAEMLAEGRCNGTPKGDVAAPAAVEAAPVVEAPAASGVVVRVGDLVDAFWRARGERPWLPPIRIAETVVDDAHLPKRDLLRLAAKALTAVAKGRGSAVTMPAKVRFQVKGKHPRDLLREVLEELQVEGVDGRALPVGRFTIDDWAHVRTSAGVQVATWERKRDVAALAADLMATHRVSVTAALPAIVLESLCVDIAEAWE